MIQVTFQFDTLQDLYEFTARQALPVPTAPPVSTLAAAAELADPPAPAAKARKPKAVKTEAPESDPETQVVEEATAVDIEVVRKAIMDVNDKFGLVPARRVLKKFSVARVTELKPEQYAEFVKACGEVK